MGYSAYGVAITLEIDSDLMAYLPSPLMHGGRLQESPADGAQLFSFYRKPNENKRLVVEEQGECVFDDDEMEMAVRTLESRIHQYVAAFTDQFVFVHAGVVEWRGKAIVIPGPSHSGKSTLVSALVANGLKYYSDEYAVIDADGRVRAFPRQLRLRPDMSASLEWTATSETAALATLPIGWVLRTRHNADAHWDPQPLTGGQTLLTLLENTVAVRRQSELTVRILKQAVGVAIGWQSERADATVAAQEIKRFLAEN